MLQVYAGGAGPWFSPRSGENFSFACKGKTNAASPHLQGPARPHCNIFVNWYCKTHKHCREIKYFHKKTGTVVSAFTAPEFFKLFCLCSFSFSSVCHNLLCNGIHKFTVKLKLLSINYKRNKEKYSRHQCKHRSN